MDYVAYRGEYGALPDLSTRHGALTFCNDFRTCEEYARYPNNRGDIVEVPRILIASLKIDRPFILQPHDPFIDLAVIAEKINEATAIRVAEKYAGFIELTNHWQEDIFPIHQTSVAEYIGADATRLNHLYFDAYPFFDCPAEVRQLRALGFDGVIVGSSGFGAGMTEYRPFSPDQISLRYIVNL